jgi:hypothetical protein
LSSHLLCRNVKVKIYKTIILPSIVKYTTNQPTTILPVILYGYETWSLTVRENHRLRMFENRVLRRIFGPKRDEVTA